MLKDTNFKEIQNDLSYSLVELNSYDLKSVNYILEQDSKFLASHNLMDYSLLLVVEHEKEYFKGINSGGTPTSGSFRENRNCIVSQHRQVASFEQGVRATILDTQKIR